MTRFQFKGRRTMIFVVGAVIGILIGTASPAMAADVPATDDEATNNRQTSVTDPTPLGECTLFFCGTVEVVSYSDRSVRIVDNWPPETGNKRYVSPGEKSTKYFKDTDGFQVPTGCTGWSPSRHGHPDAKRSYGSGWHKISDIVSMKIDMVC